MHKISTSVVYVTREHQSIFEAEVSRGTNAIELVQLSGLLQEFQELTDVGVNDLQLGVYSQKIEHDYLLEEGDRIEIYRPLTADPKIVRRQLAEMGKVMGKGASTRERT